jgi:hypothetical protein
MKSILLIVTAVVFYTSSYAFGDTTNIPIQRRKWHDDIKKEITLCDKLDGKIDNLLKVGNNDDINNQITEVLFRIPNDWRLWIEANDSLLPTNNDKVKYLKFTANALSYFRAGIRDKNIEVTDLQDFLETFEKCMKAKAIAAPMLPFIQDKSYGIANICKVLLANDTEKKALENLMYLKYVNLYPQKILTTLEPFVNEPFADSLITVASKTNLIKLYNFASSSTSPIGLLIHRSSDKLVSQVAQISQLENPLLYYPFLDDILGGRLEKDTIKKLIGDGEKGYDSLGYYRLLVKTAVSYSKRMNKPNYDTAIAYFGTNGLLFTLQKKAEDHFVKHINALHDVSNLAIRMKAIQPLNIQELYYMMVLNENIIFTSSYKHSYARLMQLMGKKPKGDSLLFLVNFDHFRKFIKMAANYNKLDTFLKTMQPQRSELIMNAFVKGLEKAPLEDAVDVADSYSSITDKKLQASVLQNITDNEAEAIANENKRGEVIYGLLKTVFKSLNDTTINLTKEFGIPPIFTVENKYVQDNNGKIVEQVFFYGDKDGKLFYPKFRASFSPKEWRVTDKPEWMEAVSIKGNVMVFANKPLDNDANLDDTAQIHLLKYFDDLGITPTLVVHRGHSYWLPRTMDRMPGNAKVVLLGSCGGYQNLNRILDLNPDAHIISTKEIGAGDINGPIFSYMNNVFNKGEDLSWIKMWQTLSKSFTKDPNPNVRSSWESYVPPYKNLGAIFLKVYSLKAE